MVNEESIEQMLLTLVRERRSLPSISERTPYPSKVAFELLFAAAPVDEQLAIKAAIPELFSKYANLGGIEVDELLAELLFLSLDVKPTLSNVLVRSIQNGHLSNRIYNGTPLTGLALNVLGDLPLDPFTRRVLLSLAEDDRFVRNVQICNQLFSVFALHHVPEGLTILFDRYRELIQSHQDAKSVARQFAASFRYLDPNWLFELQAATYSREDIELKNFLSTAFGEFKKIWIRHPTILDCSWKAFFRSLVPYGEFYDVLSTADPTSRFIALSNSRAFLSDGEILATTGAFERAARCNGIVRGAANLVVRAYEDENAFLKTSENKARAATN